MKLSTPIHELSGHRAIGVSAAMAKKLASAVAGFADKSESAKATVEDLLHYFPMRYEDRSKLAQIDDLFDGIEATVEVNVRVSGSYRVGRNRSRKAPPLYIFEISGADAARTHKPVVVWWFVSGKRAKQILAYWQKKFARGTRFVAYGKWEWDVRRNTFALKVAKPDELEILPDLEDKFDSTSHEENFGDFENAENEEAGLDSTYDAIHTGRRVPVYRKLGQFQTKRLREIVFAILQELGDDFGTDILPSGIIKRQKLIDRSRALSEIHFPPDDVSLRDYAAARSPAHRRLIFEEFFTLAFALGLRRTERVDESKGYSFNIPGKTKERFLRLLPFELTAAQKRVVDEIFSDMSSSRPMNRLLQGDVGSGKTIVAFLAMLAAMQNGYQAALMAPTEILAEQHFRKAVELFGDTEFKVELLVGSLRAAEKRRVQKAISEGAANAVVGTHAVIQDAVRFPNLGLAVIDEQHRFGVLQRAQLREHGYSPEVLVMTATPIPRSLAMTVYGDLEVSVIDELPPGRTPVKTVVVGEDKRAGVYRGIRREVEKGRQVYVVYPLIEESEKIDLRAATDMYEELQTKVFPDLHVGLIHGKLKPDEKERIMREFTGKSLDILVTTTVIEVGVDVPNATLMIVEHADRFGLSQLHQLRGRVGRGSEDSFCVLISDEKKTAVAKERLGIMEKTSDGFEIAQRDLEIRGEGEILGTRQSGIRSFRIANLVRDLKILETAKSEADRCLSEKPRQEETNRLVKLLSSDSRFRLAGIG